MFELVEEAFDKISLPIDPPAEGKAVLAIAFGWDIGLGLFCFACARNALVS
jgi:hypothetical protein